MRAQANVQEEWERAEVARSEAEARHTPDAWLRASRRTVERYSDPPADTPYPLEYAYHRLGDVRNRVVLDFGCGSGENSLLLARRGARVCGLDISASLIRLAERRLAVNGLAGAARFVVGSAHALPLADGSVDVVFGIAILHHLDLRLVSHEVHRVLRPGGRAIFQEPVRNSAALRLARTLIPSRHGDVSPYERPLTDDELAAFARPFGRAASRAFALPHVRVGRLALGARRPLAALYRWDAALLRRHPRLDRYAAIRVIELTA